MNELKEIMIKGRAYQEVGNLIENLQGTIKFLQDRMIESEKNIEEQQASEESWLYRDYMDLKYRYDACLLVLDYLSKFK